MTHYFDSEPTTASQPAEVVWSLPDGPLTIVTDRGVFGHGRVDTGTKLLLLSAPPPPPTGDLLDLGCGAGPIALTMARRAPGATVWAVDVNRRARELTAHNAAVNGIGNVRVVAPDEMLHTWLARLAHGASAHLVVQKHLGADSLQRWLVDHGFPTDRVATGAGFRVLRVLGNSVA
jgi:16S rRNA (guanine1207-N2)-methyltransferase